MAFEPPETPPRSANDAQRRRARLLREAIEHIRRTRPGFRASDNLPQEALYDRDRARAEAKAVAEKEDSPPAESPGKA